MKPAALARLAVVIIIRKDGNPEESDRTPEAQVREAVKLLLFKCRGCGMDVDPDFRTGVVHPVVRVVRTLAVTMTSTKW